MTIHGPVIHCQLVQQQSWDHYSTQHCSNNFHLRSKQQGVNQVDLKLTEVTLIGPAYSINPSLLSSVTVNTNPAVQMAPPGPGYGAFPPCVIPPCRPAWAFVPFPQDLLQLVTGFSIVIAFALAVCFCLYVIHSCYCPWTRITTKTWKTRWTPHYSTHRTGGR